MKTKQQKKEQIEKSGELLKESRALIFADISGIAAEGIRDLRKELSAANAKMMVAKKRLLGVLFKERGVGLDMSRFKMSVGTIFAKNGIESASAPVYRFFKNLKLEKEKILGGYDISSNKFIEAERVTFIGQLPPREVLLGQLVGMLASPIRSFLYVLDQKSKQS